MKLLRTLLLLLLSSAAITSCKKSVPKQTALISKNAVFVATINTKSLQSKLLNNQATIENILKSLTGNDTALNKGKQEWEDIKSSGIDLDENVYIAIDQKGSSTMGSNTTLTTSILGALKDAGKLEAYIKKKNPLSEVRKEKDYSYASLPNDNLIAWGNDVVIVMLQQKVSTPSMEYDSTGSPFNLQKPGNASADLKSELAGIFNLKESQTVASIPEFKDLMEEKADASMWVNSTSSIENAPIPLPKLKELFSNNYTAARIDFEDGKITMNSRSYYSKELSGILKQYTGPTADLGLIDNYPSDNVNAFGVLSFNPEVINGIVKYLEIGGVVDSYLTNMMGSNYTLQEALKAIKGDFAMIFSDIAVKSSADSTKHIVPGTLPNFKMIVNIPVGDKMQMNRLMDKLVEMQMMMKTGNEYHLTDLMKQSGYMVSVDDKNVFITSDAELLNQYKAKTKKVKLNEAQMNDFKGKSAVVYVNIENILAGINTNVNVRGNNVLPQAKETFKYVEGYSENFNGKYLDGHLIVHFKNDKQNSLTSLLKFIEVVSKYAYTDPAVVHYNGSHSRR